MHPVSLYPLETARDFVPRAGELQSSTQTGGVAKAAAGANPFVKFPTIFTDAQIEVLAHLHERDSQQRREGIREPLSLKALATPVAQLLFLLILEKNAKTIVEFGTSHGYSTIHLAAAADRTGGHVYTVDLMPEKTTLAAENLGAAGLLHRVTLATSEGNDFVGSLPDVRSRRLRDPLVHTCLQQSAGSHCARLFHLRRRWPRWVLGIGSRPTLPDPPRRRPLFPGLYSTHAQGPTHRRSNDSVEESIPMPVSRCGIARSS